MRASAFEEIVDVGTRVAPGVELLYERGTGQFRAQWEAIQPYLAVGTQDGIAGDWEAPYLKLAAPPRSAATEPTNGPTGAVEAGVLHDNAEGRLRAMDRLGVGVHLLSPGPDFAAIRELPSNLAAGVLGAYNRYVISYCAAEPARLKAAIQVHGAEPWWSANEIYDLAGDKAVAAVSVCLPVKIAPDDLRFRVIWQALDDTGIPLLHRPSFCASVWTPRRVLTYLAFTGIFEQYESIRIAFAEAGLGWVADALPQMEAAVEHGHRAPVEVRGYFTGGRVFAAIGPDEAAATVGDVVERLGPQALLFESNFPFRSEEPGDEERERASQFGPNAVRYLSSPPVRARAA